MTVRPERRRPEISDSWTRSAATGVDAGLSSAPVTLGDGALRDRRGSHPLGQVRGLLEDVLGDAVRDCGAVLALGDVDGHLLWVSGPRLAMRRAERIGFVAGGNWDERVAGTNAPGTSLRLDMPLMVRGGEHYLDAVRDWSCAATPIHHPVTRAVLGVLDVTGGPQIALPQTLAMVRAAARMAEAELARLTPPAGPTDEGCADPAAEFTLATLGRSEAVLSRRDDPSGALRLGPRHSEMLVVLASHPDGLTGSDLAELVYPHPVGEATVRAEVNRLRALLDPGLLASRPYRLCARVRGDWCDVRTRLDVGDVEGALRAYPGRLLPRSTAPAVEALADELEWSVRSAILAGGRPDLMAAWTRTEPGADDLEMWTAQRDHLPAGSPARAIVAARLDRLDRELAAR